MISLNNIIEKHKLKILFLITALALLIQILYLDYKSLWRDEIWRIYISEFNLISILSSPDKSHPPFYNIILHFFLYLGKSEFIVRLPSVILSVLSVPLVYLVGKKFFDYQVGLISALLFASSPLALWYAQDANMYSLFVFFSLLSILTFYIAIQTSHLQFWILFILFSLLNLYTHYFAFFIIVIQLLFIFLYMKRYSAQFSKFLISLLIIFILFIPQLFNLYQGYFLKLAEHQNTAWGIAPILFPKIIFLDLAIGHSWWQGSSLLDYIVILFLFLFFYGLIASYKDHQESVSFLAIWVFIPLLLAFLLSYKIDIATRYILFILPGFLISIAQALRLIKKNHYILFLTLLFIILSSNTICIYKSYNTPMEDWRSAAEFIKGNSHPDDAIIIVPSFATDPFIFYGVNSSQIIDVGDKISNKEMVEEINKLCMDSHRVWIAYFPHASIGITRQGFLTWLSANCMFMHEANPNIQIFLCENCTSRKDRSSNSTAIVYDEIPLNYPWTGFMGSDNGSSLQYQGGLDVASTVHPYTGTFCAKMSYNRTREEWIGVWIQGTGDWNRGPGIGEDLTGATKLTFYARGEQGGEIVTFAYGYSDPSGQHGTTDSSHGEQTIRLTPAWDEYSFDLSEEPVSYINGLFMVVIDKESNPEEVVIYIDNISYSYT